MQRNVILAAEPWGLPLDLKILPQYLKDDGYKTHAVGKWHLGFFQTAYTPTKRGFDSHFGYWTGKQDYYDHTAQEGQVSDVLLNSELVSIRQDTMISQHFFVDFVKKKNQQEFRGINCRNPESGICVTNSQ